MWNVKRNSGIYYFLNDLCGKPSEKAFDEPGSLNAVRSRTQSSFLASSSKKSMSLAVVIKTYSSIRQCSVLAGKFTRLQSCIGVPAYLSVKTLFFTLMNDFSLFMCRFKKALLCLLVCIQLLMNRIHRWKDAVNYLVCSEQGICRIIGDYTTKILVNEMGKEKLTL